MEIRDNLCEGPNGPWYAVGAQKQRLLILSLFPVFIILLLLQKHCICLVESTNSN